MAITCTPCDNSMVNSWTIYGRTCNSSIYSVGIHWGLLIKFSHDIRLLSVLLIVLASSFHNTYKD